MDRIDKYLIGIGLVILLFASCSAASGDANAGKDIEEKTYSTDSYEEETQFLDIPVTYDEEDPLLEEELIAIPGSNILCYGSVSKTVKYCFVRSDGFGDTRTSSGFMDDFILHGHPCEYQDGKIVMIHYSCNDTCPYR